eukprot:gene3450-6086_t
MEGVWSIGCDSRLHPVTESTAVYTCNSLLCSVDIASREVKARIVDPSAPVFALTANSTEQVIAFVLESSNPVISVCEANSSFDQIAQLSRENVDALISDLAFDSSGRLLYAIDAPPHKSLVLWDWQDERILSEIELDSPNHYKLCVNSNLWTQCLVFNDEVACVWEVEIVRNISNMTDRPIDLTLTKRQRQGSQFGRRTSLEQSLNLQMVFEDETVLSVVDAYFHDDSTIVCGCVDGELIEADFDTRATRVAITSSKFGSGAFQSLLWDGTNAILLAAAKDGTLRWFQWTEADPLLLRTVSTYLGITSLSLVGQTIVAGGIGHVSILDEGDHGVHSSRLKPIIQGQHDHASAIFTCLVSVSKQEESKNKVTFTETEPQERIVTVSSSQTICQHTLNGQYISSTDISGLCDGTITTSDVAHCAGLLVIGNNFGLVQAYRLTVEGELHLIAEASAHTQPVRNLAADPAGSLIISTSANDFVIFSLPDFGVRCSGSFKYPIKHSSLTYRASNLTALILLEYADNQLCALTFKIPEDQRTLGDLFFSDQLLQVDVDKAPISIARLPHDVEDAVLTENFLLCWNIRSGSFYACVPPTTVSSVSSVPFEKRLQNAPSLEVLEIFRGIFGRSSTATVSLAGHYATAISSSGQLMTVPLSSRSTNTQAPVLTCLQRTRDLQTLDPVAHGAWSLDGTLFIISSPSGTLAALQFTNTEERREQNAAIAKQSQHYRAVTLMPTALKIIKQITTMKQTKNLIQEKKSFESRRSSRTAVVDAMVEAQRRILQEAASGQEELYAEISSVRQKLQALIDENETAIEEEKLPREDFVLDMDQNRRLKASLEAAVSDRQRAIENEILKEQYLRSIVKDQCWDTMEVPGKRLYGFDSKLEVVNFPLRKLTLAEKNTYKRIIGLRRTEMAVKDQLYKLNSELESQPVTPVSPKMRSEQQQAQDQQHLPEDQVIDKQTVGSGMADENAGQQQTPVSSESPETASIITDNDEDDGDDSDLHQCLYHPLELQTASRKRSQIVMLERYVRLLKARFNDVFDEHLELKQDHRSKIAEKNAIISKICLELKMEPNLYTPDDHVLENPEQLLEVKDHEISVEHVLSKEEQRQLEEEAELEAKRRAAAAKDNAHERGINEMMYGRLEGPEDDGVWNDIPRPEFMDTTTKDEWTDEQKREAQAYEKEYKDLMERRDKRKKALDGKLRTLYSEIQDLLTSFDNRLNELFHQRIEAEQTVAREELAILMLAKSLQDEQDLVDEELNIRQHIDDCRRRQAPKAQAVQQALEITRTIAQELHAIQLSDKQLEKSFRSRKEFAELDSATVDQLFRFFRKKKSLSQAQLTEPKDFDRPDHVDDYIWSKVLKLRVEKYESEQRVLEKTQELDEAEAFLKRRKQEEAELSQEIERAMTRLSEVQKLKSDLNVDAEILVTVKQGQVELQHEDNFDPSFADAILIDRGIIESLNSTIRKLAEGKIDHIQKAIEMSQGVRLLEWQHQRLDLEREQLKQKTKEVQLFKVTKTTVQPSRERKKDHDLLEKTKERMLNLHVKKVEERKKKIAKLKRELQKKRDENEKLISQTEQLAVEVGERAQVRKVQMAALGDGGAKDRLRLCQFRHKIVHDIREQASDISILQEEVERLRLRTFPTFGPNSSSF